MNVKHIPKFLFLIGLLLLNFQSLAESGYKLWLRYAPIENEDQISLAKEIFAKVVLPDESQSKTFAVIKDELIIACRGFLGDAPDFIKDFGSDVSLVVGTPSDFVQFQSHLIHQELESLGEEGYYIEYLGNNKRTLAIIANKPVGALYGTFHLLRLIQSGPDFQNKLPIRQSPKITHRMLDHWDNLDRTIERGYAGFSIWDWHRLPVYIDQRYIDYARANASIGINGAAVTNVNANSLVLTPMYLEKVAALADVFRPYGIKIYLTARFSSPIEIGKLDTADPLVPEVREWWKAKAREIYEKIPDFGGFLVKANSEGQPGPQNYDRSHADGANMLAEAVGPYGGVVIWRAFVYSHEVPDDRAKQANNEFEPLDGKFKDNVFIQVKNGAIDFQPREPFHPLFGAMSDTKLALELQITMEYLGQATSLVYLGPLFEECLDSKTYKPTKKSTVATIIDGTDFKDTQSMMAGVANIGNDINWTGHLLNQANWYVFGRLAWDHDLTSGQIAKEWINLTFGNSDEIESIILDLMLSSRETVVNYMTPLGLHHIMGRNHHYGPGPWVTGGRPDWTSVYYHKADSTGLGFDRMVTGSNALSQYAPEIETAWSDLSTCPEKYLLWFHHLPWNYRMKSGETLWNELCHKYDEGVKGVRKMREQWKTLNGKIDSERFNHVRMLLDVQEKEAVLWRNSCLLYFQQFSRMSFPKDIEQPEGDLEYYENLNFPYAPGIRPRW